MNIDWLIGNRIELDVLFKTKESFEYWVKSGKFSQTGKGSVLITNMLTSKKMLSSVFQKHCCQLATLAGVSLKTAHYLQN